MAPTAKAALQLNRKGISDAATIHKAIYWFEGKEKDEETDEVELRFKRRGIDWTGGIVVVDESSMVNLKLADDLRETGASILWVGDHGQLEPIGANPHLMRSPNFRLEKIHRQAEGNPILAAAHAIRHQEIHEPGALPRDPEGRLNIFSRAATRPQGIVEYAAENGAGMILTPMHKQRRTINLAYRDFLGYTAPHPVPGDRVICILNNYALGVINGEDFVVLGMEELDPAEFENWMGGPQDRDPAPYKLFLRNPVNDDEFGVPFNPERMGDDKGRPPEDAGSNDPEAYFDWAYAITVHKAQGSEWGRVIYCDPGWWPDAWIGETQVRMRYTAITRASDTLDIVA